MLAAAKGSANFYSADIHDPIGVYTAWSKQQACATGNCLNSQPVFEHLFPFFNASVTVSGNVTIPLFGSRSNKIMLYSDLAGAYALNASGVASVFIDASVNRLTRGTHIAKTIEGLLIYNKQITTVNFVVQQNSTETCSVFQAALERFITQAAAASCGTGRSSITPYSLAAWTTGGTLSACQSAIAKRADRADDTSLGKRVRSAETFITDVHAALEFTGQIPLTNPATVFVGSTGNFWLRNPRTRRRLQSIREIPWTFATVSDPPTTFIHNPSRCLTGSALSFNFQVPSSHPFAVELLTSRGNSRGTVYSVTSPYLADQLTDATTYTDKIRNRPDISDNSWEVLFNRGAQSQGVQNFQVTLTLNGVGIYGETIVWIGLPGRPDMLMDVTFLCGTTSSLLDAVAPLPNQIPNVVPPLE
ncbi:hypothetical protein HDU90_004209 [Geranomyces variabilis]|nr:hypothetical protein HDU90_004209 [Geranomyces variabilis]